MKLDIYLLKSKYSFMKKNLLLSVLLIPLAFFGQEKEAPLQVVRVYLNSAELTHRVEVNLKQGTQTVVLKGLSPYLMQESLVLKSSVPVDVIDMKFRKDFLVSKRYDRQIKELEQELNKLNGKISELEAVEEGLNGEKKILLANMQSKNPSLTWVTQYSAYYKKRILVIERELFDVSVKLKPLYERQKKLKNQLQTLQGKAQNHVKDLVLSLSSKSAGKAVLEISYVTRNASWRPVYSIRSNDFGQPLKWEMKAEIRQNTGIDWVNIPVGISTLAPKFYMQVPKPSPWYLSVYDNAIYGYRSAGAVKSKKTNMESAPVAEVKYAEVQTVETDLDVEYTLKAKYTVLSGDEGTQVHLKSFETPAEYVYYAVPYLNPSAYLTATVKDLDQYRLIPGNARVYFANRFTGKTYIDPQRDKKIRLSLGVDKAIEIKRKRVNNYHDYNLTGGKVTVSRVYEITVINHKSKAVDMTVKDRVPVSQDEKITVKNVQTDGGTADRNGIVTWKLRLAPGEKKVLRFSYEVKFPKDHKPVGF